MFVCFLMLLNLIIIPIIRQSQIDIVIFIFIAVYVIKRILGQTYMFDSVFHLDQWLFTQYILSHYIKIMINWLIVWCSTPYWHAVYQP